MGLIRIIIDFIKKLFGFETNKPINKHEELLIQKEKKLKDSIKNIDNKLGESIQEKDSLEDELEYWNNEDTN